MRTIVKGKNIDVPEHVKEYAERKMHRLERLMDDSTDAVVELSAEQHRSAADSQIVEVTLIVGGQTIRSHAAGPTHQAGLDAVIDRIERQAVDAQEARALIVVLSHLAERHQRTPQPLPVDLQVFLRWRLR